MNCLICKYNNKLNPIFVLLCKKIVINNIYSYLLIDNNDFNWSHTKWIENDLVVCVLFLCFYLCPIRSLFLCLQIVLNLMFFFLQHYWAKDQPVFGNSKKFFLFHVFFGSQNPFFANAITFLRGKKSNKMISFRFPDLMELFTFFVLLTFSAF